ncbi:glycerophosphodiester phosphodiesterase [Pseudoponticoccus marisrubri]|uniref:GP-PDE domain-containing protein n=1 Tax=Pseudoponticoccus marisrubri TaxID=1685382 RepID=A0A0W7WHA5_9RHOB|nr:glycerophosphodiester phosphodiesterase family protein [Pseudoponticoccus marisrubri]KUF09996.1 hypothetical protein AVJ23_14725 [Pseudoponticoccus marisrubri]
MSDWLTPSRPYSIAHRGASAYAADCSLAAYEKAARLGADFWEVDIRSAACGTLITYHDAALPDGKRLRDLTAEQIATEARAQNVPAVPFLSVVALAVETGAGIYADIKDREATIPVMKALRAHGVERAILGAFDPASAEMLDAAQCPYPRAVLVPLGAEPFEYAKGADIIHLCWERMERPQDALTPEFFDECRKRGQKVVLWHEEDPDRMAVLCKLPVLGICSDRPELVHPFRPPAEWPVEITCHRGACEFAPENTLPSTHCAFAAGFHYVELDLRSSADGRVYVFHDDELSRCTDGRGSSTWYDFEHLRALDAGSHFDPFFAGERIPEFAEILDIAKRYGGQLYVELKDADPAATLAAINAAGMLERCFFWAYDLHRLNALRALCPQARLSVRLQDVPSLEAARAFNPEIIEFTLQDDLTQIATCRDLGLRSMLAYMGNKRTHFEQIATHRPDIVNLHFPFLFRDFLAEKFPAHA